MSPRIAIAALLAVAGCKKIRRSGDSPDEASGAAATGAARELTPAELARYLPADTTTIFAVDLEQLRGSSFLDALAAPFMSGPPKPIAHRWDEACKFSPWRDVEIMMLGQTTKGPFTWVARMPSAGEHPLMDCAMRELRGTPKELHIATEGKTNVYLLPRDEYAFAFVAPHIVVGGPPDRVRAALRVNPVRDKQAPQPAMAALLAKLDPGRSVFVAMTDRDPLGLGLETQGLWGSGWVDSALRLRLSTQLLSAEAAREAAASMRGGIVGIDEVKVSAAGDVLVVDLAASQVEALHLMTALDLAP